MQLEGSCHCRAVTFQVQSQHPYPYSRCYCTICRKTTGAGGYAINIRADTNTLRLHGREHIRIYHAKIQSPEKAEVKVSGVERHFCKICGSALFVYHPDFPQGIYPMASAIDTPLPKAPSHIHMMLDFRADWTPVEAGPNDRQTAGYPGETVDEWHQRLKRDQS